jgi:hypothetical protein
MNKRVIKTLGLFRNAYSNLDTVLDSEKCPQAREALDILYLARDLPAIEAVRLLDSEIERLKNE